MQATPLMREIDFLSDSTIHIEEQHAQVHGECDLQISSLPEKRIQVDQMSCNGENHIRYGHAHYCTELEY